MKVISVNSFLLGSDVAKVYSWEVYLIRKAHSIISTVFSKPFLIPLKPFRSVLYFSNPHFLTHLSKKVTIIYFLLRIFSKCFFKLLCSFIYIVLKRIGNNAIDARCVACVRTRQTFTIEMF